MRLKVHVLFWVLCTLGLTMVYRIGIPDYLVSFKVILMFMPVYIFYFYITAYLVIPRYLFTRKYVKFALAFLTCMLVSVAAFRLIEICFADPYIYRFILKNDPGFVWHKLEGSFRTQMLKPAYIVSAFEQSNIIIWIAISLKFYKMWHEKRQVALQAELNFLKGQIHPHFLFNTLNNLYALTLKQSGQASSVVLGLSDILRYMLYECRTETVALLRDVEILESYASLEKIRYEDRLDLTMSITGNLNNHVIAPLLMLPLVENAFKHGISEMMTDAWINIDLQVKASKLKLKVSNSKPPQSYRDDAGHYGKIGLKNVRKRLELLYTDAHKLNVYDEEDMFVTILELELNKHLKTSK